MAVKTFTTGEVLTAADTNTYLANSGLVFVKGVAVSGSVASVNVTSCFSGTYDAYRVVITNLTLTTNTYTTVIFAKLLDNATPASTNYNYGIPRVDLANGAVSANYAQNGTAGIWVGNGNASDRTGAAFDVINPFAAYHTVFTGLIQASNSAGYSGAGAGLHASQVSYNGIQISCSTGNMTNGAIIVYGYRYGIG